MAWLNNLFQSSYSADETELFRFLQETDLFYNLTFKELSYFAPHLYERNYVQDEAVFFRGDPSHALYVVKNGQVKVSLDVKGKMEELATLHRFGVFGKNSFINDQKRVGHAVVSSEKADLYVLPQVHIRNVFQHRPTVQAKVMENLATLYCTMQKNLYAGYREEYGFFNLGLIFIGD